MTELPMDISQIDRDGAVAEAAHRVAGDSALADSASHGDTRAQILRKFAVGGGALVGGGLLLGGLTSTAIGADTRSAKQDQDILNYALTLEYLEAAFYAEAVASNKLTGETKQFAEIVAGHEAAHVDFLKNALGSNAVASPKFDFKGIPSNPDAFMRTAVVLEDTGVAAYIGQSFRLKKTAFILVAAQVLAVEARHAAWARGMVGSRLPAEKDEVLNARANMKQVLAAVTFDGLHRPVGIARTTSAPGPCPGAASSVDVPASVDAVAVGQHDATGIDHQLVVVAIDRAIGPPEVLHQPVVADGDDTAMPSAQADRAGDPTGIDLHPGAPWHAQRAQRHGSSGVRAQRRSGSRDQGSISTRRSIASSPCAARTWRTASPARARRSSAGEGIAVS